MYPSLEVIYFNCTIQELKRHEPRGDIRSRTFQLHHTGIKTVQVLEIVWADGSFQLHHTGIKTELQDLPVLRMYNFNCTIQELKQKIDASCP